MLLASADGGAWAAAACKVLKSLSGVELKAECVGSYSSIVRKERKRENAAGISSTWVLLMTPDIFVAWRERRIPVEFEKESEEVMR